MRRDRYHPGGFVDPYQYPAHLRCVGGPMHGRSVATQSPRLEVPVYGQMDDACFVGNNPSPDTVHFRTVMYVQRMFQQTSPCAVRRERVLVPERMPIEEAERLWLTLTPTLI